MLNYKEEFIKSFNDKSRKYYIEHFLSTYDATERREVPFNVFPRQYELLKSLANNKNTIAVKHRQAGITTMTAAWCSAQCLFASPSSPETILCVGNSRDISEQLLEKITNFLDQAPRWMWGGNFYSPDPDNPVNTKSIYKTRNKNKVELFNGCKIYAKSSGQNAARGVSAVSILIFDEAAFIKDGPIVYAQAVAATSSVANAKIIMISTPNGKDQLYYKTYQQALTGSNNYNPVEFKWYQDLRYQRNLKWYKKNKKTGEVEWINEPTINKRGDIIYDEEKWRNMEKDGWKAESPWYLTMCKTFNNDEQRIAQELDVSFLGSSDNVIPTAVIEAHAKQNVVDIAKNDNWPLRDPFVKDTWIWKEPIPGHRYICSCLIEKEKVLTNHGLINVEAIKYDDKLININGNEVKIKAFMKRHCQNEDVFTIKLKGIEDTTTFTYNHPIWASKYTNSNEFKFGYYKVKDLSPLDWLRVPNVYTKNLLSNSAICDKYKEFCDDDIFKIPQLSPLYAGFWYNCGVWIMNRKNGFTKEEYKKIEKFLLYSFGFNNNLYIDTWIKHLPHDYKLYLISGIINSCGYQVHNNELTIRCSSKQLLNDIQDILFSTGIISYVKKVNTIYHLTIKKVPKQDEVFISEDNSYIYIPIESVTKAKYTGTVYNFETETHSYCTNYIATHNCDASSGSSEDRTAIEMIDIDAVDENTGTPYFDQVLEYYGKRTGDEIGEMIFEYATRYNNALVVVECIGGYGDAIILTLMAKKYKNIYYDDPGLKTYTVEKTYSRFNIKDGEKLPGFRTNGVRVQMIGNFVTLLKENGFRVRSVRVINEMDTWIWKNGRPDHMDGCHDDSLTCLAMGLFVVLFYVIRHDTEKDRTKAMLQSFTSNKIIQYGNYTPTENPLMLPKQQSSNPNTSNPFLFRYRK